MTGRTNPVPTFGAARPTWFEMFGALGLMTVLVGTSVYWCDQVAHSARYSVALQRVSSQAAATAVPYDGEGSARTMMAARDQWNMFDNDLSSALRQAYEASPWVRRVDVKRKFPGTVEVDVDLVEPFACAEWDDGQYLLVTSDGEILPSVADSQLVGKPLIRAFVREGDTRHRSRLKDEDFGWFASAVREGAAVIGDLTQHAWSGIFDRLFIMTIDVSNYGGRISPDAPEVVIETERQWADPSTGVRRPTVIYWGRSTRHPRGSIELPIARKLDHIETVLAQNPSLGGIAIIDVRFKDVVFRRPDPAAAAPKTR